MPKPEDAEKRPPTEVEKKVQQLAHAAYRSVGRRVVIFADGSPGVMGAPRWVIEMMNHFQSSVMDYCEELAAAAPKADKP